jgi:hypothetical protein
VNIYGANFAEVIMPRGRSQASCRRCRERGRQRASTATEDASRGAMDSEVMLRNIFARHGLSLYDVIDEPRNDADKHYGGNGAASLLPPAMGLKDVKATAQSATDDMATAGRRRRSKAEPAMTPSGARSAAERRCCAHCGALHRAIVVMRTDIRVRAEAGIGMFMEALRHGEAYLDALIIKSYIASPRLTSRQGK